MIQKPTILIVDDEDEIGTLLGKLFEMEGFAVHVSDDGFTALERLDKHPEIALMITDLGMTHMEGMELIFIARKKRPSMKIVAMSGMSGPKVEALVTSGHADLFVAKPFCLSELVASVKSLLGIT